MCRNHKKIMLIVLVLCMSIIPFNPVLAADTVIIPRIIDSSTDEIMPLYNNVASSNTTMSINSTGKMTISYRYTGYSSTTTKAIITTYIEKRVLGLFWTRVDIGETDDQWVDTIYDYKYNGTRTYQLSDSGTYRVAVTYKIYGTGGSADTITTELKDSY